MAFLGIMPDNPSVGEQLARSVGQGLQSGASSLLNFAQQMALEKQKSSSLAQQTKQLEKIKTMETGLGTIAKMRELLSSAGGWTSDPMTKIQSLFPGETQSKRSELEALGRSLIPLVAAGVPIRNQKEFEEYRKVITDPSSSPAQFEGALNAIEDILTRSIEGNEPELKSKEMKKESKSKDPMVKMMTPKGERMIPKSRVKEAMNAGAKVIK